MNAPALVFVLLVSGLLAVSACEKPAAPPPAPADSAAASASAAGSVAVVVASNLPHDYGDLTEAEIAHAIDEEYVIAMVRVGSFVLEGQGTKSAAIRYEVDLLQPMLGSPSSNVMQYGEHPTLAVGRVYAMIVNRKRASVHAVEVPEHTYKDFGRALAERVERASVAAAEASASAAASASVSASAASSAKPLPSSASTKAAAAPLVTPSTAGSMKK